MNFCYAATPMSSRRIQLLYSTWDWRREADAVKAGRHNRAISKHKLLLSTVQRVPDTSIYYGLRYFQCLDPYRGLPLVSQWKVGGNVGQKAGNYLILRRHSQQYNLDQRPFSPSFQHSFIIDYHFTLLEHVKLSILKAIVIK